MEKFETHAGTKTFDELVEELMPRQDDPVVATGPQGPTGFPFTPPGANGPAGPLNGPVPTGPTSSPNLPPERDRAEVDLRQAIRRCFKEGVPLDRMVEIFRLELVDVVHDD